MLHPDFAMNEETAKAQTDLVAEAYSTLASSRMTLQHLAEGQTDVVWTADGKSVALSAVLTEKYQTALAWLDSIETELNDAATKLDKAIENTVLLDEDQKASHQKLLYRAKGYPGKTIAV